MITSRISLNGGSRTIASIAQNHAAILESVVAACARVDRSPEEVTVIAVSKTVGPAQIAEAVAAGIHDFGENRTSLLKQRQELFPSESWHFIGRIQTNKIRDIVGRATLVHSVASQRALQAISVRAREIDVVQKLLIEVNVSGEASKDGVTPEQLLELLDLATQMKHIAICGLMTIAPQGDESATRRTFNGLRTLRDRYAPRYEGCPSVNLCELSMGMTEDYVLAVEEGATILRIGRGLWFDPTLLDDPA